MKKVCGMSLAMALSVAFATLASAQQDAKKTPNPATKSSAGSPKSAAREGARPLILSGSVPMEGVKGRFDHFASGQGQVFISALGNNTVEVISIFGGTVEHTITGVPGPQGVAFSPEASKLFVASEKASSTSMTPRHLISSQRLIFQAAPITCDTTRRPNASTSVAATTKRRGLSRSSR